MDGYIGEIRMFGGSFPPVSWAFCEGQLLAVSSNTALFSILGTTYGGDGRTTFGLPDCRGRLTVHPGTGPGLSNYNLGQKTGVNTVVLNSTNLPQHTHNVSLNASSEEGEDTTPVGNVLGKAESEMYKTTSDATMNANSITVTNRGGNQPILNIQPIIAMQYIICLVGIYPSRS